MGDVIYLAPNLPSLTPEQVPAWVASLTVQQMKIMWDKWDTWRDQDPGDFVIEEIHMEMNRRGEGEYVAV